jgi:hypothetical protein
MIVSDVKKFIIFQPWKCASTTLYIRLKKYDSEHYPQDIYYNEVLKKYSHKHIRLSDFIQLPEASLDYTKICYVRNPYDRIYAGYLQLLKEMKQGNDIPMINHIKEGFNTYLKYYTLPVYESTDEFWGGKLHEYTHFENKKYVDCIGYVERFEKDFKQIFNKLGINDTETISGNIKNKPKTMCNPHNMKRCNYKYIDKYTQEDIEIVNYIFKDDFEIFNYKIIK